MKPYQKIPIEDNGEILVPIPLDKFAVEHPHPYEKLGANYQGRSAYFLRKTVLAALLNAQEKLQNRYPGWRIKIFDAYRPIAVQQFMVDYSFELVLQQRGLSKAQLTSTLEADCWEAVYKIWAIPSHNPATPPPHSTGAAVDITLVNENDQVLSMGGEIDELSDRSDPNYYSDQRTAEAQRHHSNRQLLNTVMVESGFHRHPGEWWHFSLGDQMWALQENRLYPEKKTVASYGGVN